MKILIVENSISISLLIRTILEKNDYVSMLAENGKQAIDILSKDTDFDAILMDYEMPIMDGKEATQIIRKLDNKLRNIPIILLTAHETDYAEKLLKYGFTDYLTKPFNMKNIMNILNKHIKNEEL